MTTLILILASLLNADNAQEISLQKNKIDHAPILFLPSVEVAGKYHKEVAQSKTGSNLEATHIASNLWCADTNCTPWVAPLSITLLILITIAVVFLIKEDK